MSPCYEADYIVARKRTAALGELDKAVVDTLDNDALLALRALFLRGFGYLDNVLFNRLRLFKFLYIFVLYVRHHLVERDSTVADCRKEILGAVKALFLSYFKHKLVKLLIIKTDKITLELRLDLHPALKDILLASLLFKP